jgi:hypothetical protein
MNSVFLALISRSKNSLIVLMDKISAKNSLIQRLKFQATAAIASFKPGI